MYDTLDSYAIFHVQLVGYVHHVLGRVLTYHHLGYPVAVAKIDEMDSPVVPVPVDPSVEDNGFSVVRFS
jgi:hypothetical protein